jgi:membrane-bound lytic murein transglycosylase D
MSFVNTDTALPSPPVLALPKLSNLAKAARKPIVRVNTGSASKLNVNAVRHPRVDEWVERLTTTHKRSYQVSLARKEKYEGMISSKLAARKMPQELIYLAMIESNFNPNAQSPAKAVGLWQFMSATARRFGLTVGGRVDERRDPARATDAALSYLTSLYNRFGSWYLAAAAYNSGEGTIQRALRSVTGKPSGTDADFFRILPRLPRETQDYVPKLIAWARVGQSPERYGMIGQVASKAGSAIKQPASAKRAPAQFKRQYQAIKSAG